MLSGEIAERTVGPFESLDVVRRLTCLLLLLAGAGFAAPKSSGDLKHDQDGSVDVIVQYRQAPAADELAQDGATTKTDLHLVNAVCDQALLLRFEGGRPGVLPGRHLTQDLEADQPNLLRT